MRSHDIIRVGLLSLLTSLAMGEETSTRAVMPEKHLAVFETYCLDCHDTDTQKGKLDLETISLDITSNLETAEHWQNILDAINAGEMPPEDKKQISSEEKAALLSDLSVAMVKARNILSDSGGEITIRRLNRREYQNTLEALLGFRPDVANLPSDDETGGFDTSGASLYFSSDQFEQYRATARTALNHAWPARARPEPTTVRFEGETITAAVREKADAKTKQVRDARAYLAQSEKPPSAFGFRDEDMIKNQLGNAEYDQAVWKHYFFDRPESATGAVLRPGRHNGPWKRLPRFRIPHSHPGGSYKIRVRTATYPDVAEIQRYLRVSVNSGKESVSSLDGIAKVSAPLDDPEVVELTIDSPHGMKGQFTLEQRNYIQPYPYKIDMEWVAKNGVGRPAALWVDYFEVEGPFFDQSLDRFPNLVAPIADQPDAEYIRELIHQFGTIAFRDQAPTEEYVEKLAAHYLQLRKEELTKREASIECLALVLSSPSFLYLSEPREDADNPSKLTERELAVRLSYFLWSSPPDGELLTLAEAGKLSDPSVLQAQTDRLLSDPKARRFIDGFAHQWLDMKRLDMFEFNALIHPDFDEAVRASAREEVYATLANALKEKLPIETLLKSDWVVINDILADFYDLPDVEGSEFRKVNLPDGSPRGGFLGMAATHIMGSDGQRSSPVERGVWVLRHLLHDPPPPAPANVPMLEHEDAALPIRDLQRRHQEEAQCAQCHRKIDPIGYGLENFSAAGLWRQVEEVVIPNENPRKAPEAVTFPIDPSGTLPKGEAFDDYFALRDQITEQYGDAFARGLSEHLIGYALGRPYQISDFNLASDIVTQAEENGNDLASFLHALIQSPAFQIK